MVITIVPFNKRGRPWSDHGQFMVILWSTMVMDHDRPWSEHGRPWSDHDPATRATFLAKMNISGLPCFCNRWVFMTRREICYCGCHGNKVTVTMKYATDLHQAKYYLGRP